ncbi:serine/threonine-protein kinase [Micromonospora mangrovi]|uniref:non-specific serine/threonine protein kinase n=2 Tax=Micromonospora TaxID=1873 RepID=A0AAU7M751_9ACTN
MSRPWPVEGDLLAGRYRMTERLRLGGMSVIWRAHDETLHRMVAVKLPVVDAPLRAAAHELLRRESRATARLAHPDVVTVHDCGEATSPDGDRVFFMVMQLVTGEPLAEVLADGPLSWPDAARIAQRVARVLVAAHADAIVHRDINPENVLLTPDGVKVVDFGINARIGEPDDGSGWTFGTPPYVPPERVAGAAVAPASDVYALGALLFEMLAGRPPYPETTWDELAAVRRPSVPPAPPGAPAELAELCQRCLRPEPDLRPSAAEVAASLMALVDGRSSAAVRAWPGPPPRRPARRRAIVTTGLGLAAAVGVVAVWASSPGDPPPRTAPTPPATPVPGTPGPPRTTGATVGSPRPAPPRRTGRTPLLTVSAAREQVYAVIDRNARQGGMSPDAAQDLRQALANLTRNGVSDGRALDREMGALRRRVADRVREGRVTAAAAAELDRALERFAVAFRTALGARGDGSTGG